MFVIIRSKRLIWSVMVVDQFTSCTIQQHDAMPFTTTTKVYVLQSRQREVFDFEVGKTAAKFFDNLRSVWSSYTYQIIDSCLLDQFPPYCTAGKCTEAILFGTVDDSSNKCMDFTIAVCALYFLSRPRARRVLQVQYYKQQSSLTSLSC